MSHRSLACGGNGWRLGDAARRRRVDAMPRPQEMARSILSRGRWHGHGLAAGRPMRVSAVVGRIESAGEMLRVCKSLIQCNAGGRKKLNVPVLNPWWRRQAFSFLVSSSLVPTIPTPCTLLSTRDVYVPDAPIVTRFGSGSGRNPLI